MAEAKWVTVEPGHRWIRPEASTLEALAALPDVAEALSNQLRRGEGDCLAVRSAILVSLHTVLLLLMA